MPPPPPPPLPSSQPALPVNSAPKDSPAPSTDINALLSQIRKGAKLKKAVTNDRSAPLVDGKSKKSSDHVSEDGNPSPRPGGRSFSGSQNMLAGLFAQGMPKLKPTNSSFLQGGAYKSQLDPRETIKQRSMSKSCNDLGSNGPVQNQPSPITLKGKQWPKVDGCSKANSTQGLNSDEILSKKESSDAQSINKRSDCPEPPPSNMKPNFETSDKSYPVRSFLHNDEIGGSEPNLNITVKQKSRPLPQTPLRIVNGNGTALKPAVNCKSFEDSDVLSSKVTNNKLESHAERSLKYSTLKNTSMPSNLNEKIFANADSPSPVVPVRRYNKTSRPVKPSVAPPPAPVRSQTSSSGNSSYARQSGTLRAPPPPPPIMSPPPPPGPMPPPPPPMVSPPPVPRPPPPPQRNQKYTITLTRTKKSSRNSADKRDSMDSPSSLEARFQFKDIFEFPKPDTFCSKAKTYPSEIAKMHSRKKMCQPPPNAPPPPPVNHSRA